MLASNTWALPALLAVGVAATRDHHGDEEHPHPDETTMWDPTCTANVTVFDTTVIPQTTYLDVVVNVTETSTLCVTESITTTLICTVNVTETETDWTTLTETDVITLTNTDFTTLTDTDLTTLTDTDLTTVTDTDTDLTTVTNTDTDLTTVTNTDSTTITETDSVTITTTDTVPATVTTFTTTTLLETVFDPCPTTCKVDVDTVNLYFWPSDRPFTYPSTHYDEVLDYTFTYPSVYMLIPTASGTDTAGQPAGPATTSWVLALDLEEVSTIVDGTITSQLNLADLGTDCPKSRNPTEIATLVDSACAPILAAPTAVSSWANPCNACGHFGLFDPPYAVPTLPGGLIGTTTVIETEPMTTAAPEPTTVETVVPEPEPTTVETVVPEPEPTTVETVVPEPEPTTETVVPEPEPTTVETSVVETPAPEPTTIETETSVVSSPVEVPPTESDEAPEPAPTTAADTGVIVVVHVSDDVPVSTETLETEGIFGTLTSFVDDAPTGGSVTDANTSAELGSPGATDPTTIPDGGSAASRESSGLAWLMSSVFAVAILL